MTPQNVITDARFSINDTDATAYRNTDVELLGWVNEALGISVSAREDLFNALGDHTCQAGAEQQVSFVRCNRGQEVTRVIGGNAVLPTSQHDCWQYKHSKAHIWPLT